MTTQAPTRSTRPTPTRPWPRRARQAAAPHSTNAAGPVALLVTNPDQDEGGNPVALPADTGSGRFTFTGPDPFASSALVQNEDGRTDDNDNALAGGGAAGKVAVKVTARDYFGQP